MRNDTPPEPPAIRPADAADAGRIAALHCESWRDAYAQVLDPAFLAGPIEADRRALWAERLGAPAPAQGVLLAETPGHETAGFICFFRDNDPRWGTLIDNLHVDPALRGRGIGERLIRAAVATFAPDRPFHLWVFEANAAGVRFYLRLGGTIVERGIDDKPAARGAPHLRIA
ncbi:GNAT family N-acetyltransferase [Novosphingobium sp.]|uniref:GNAT family N-acetyltransferase n=1 Tax=Novosphingobium sp. TaxID=1874826 RepID=UPI00261281D9|nr:GNAT family N-acetyltransferase [Novosphingobium sp.]